MVIKTSTCAFSDNKIYPGHGLRYCEVNGRAHNFLSKKVHRFFRTGRKPLKFRWNQKWRIAHKKVKTEENKRTINRQRKEKIVKAVVGRTLEELKKIKESLDERQLDGQRYKYAQEIKDKKKKFLEKVRKSKPQTFERQANQPKVTKNVATKATKGKSK